MSSSLSAYVVLLSVPKRVHISGFSSGLASASPKVSGRDLAREDFFSWLWKQFSDSGLVGVHEGTLLSEEAAEKGLSEGFVKGPGDEAWTLDSAEAPPSRDWVAEQELENAELYFSSEAEAKAAADILAKIPELKVGGIREQKPQDWDADWKASFLNAGAGVPIAPFWRVVPPWVKPGEVLGTTGSMAGSASGAGSASESPSEKVLEQSSEKLKEKWIKINPGAGFGTGTHETTQLCLQAIGEYSKKIPLETFTCLDFGSGSGILAIAMALLGARVDAVEVDSLAINNSIENAELNGVHDHIYFTQTLPACRRSQPRVSVGGELKSVRTYRYVIANILRPVLLEFAPQLCERLQPGGVLILSGLIERDVAPVVEAYSALLGPLTQVYSLGEWRALVFLKAEFRAFSNCPPVSFAAFMLALWSNLRYI